MHLPSSTRVTTTTHMIRYDGAVTSIVVERARGRRRRRDVDDGVGRPTPARPSSPRALRAPARCSSQSHRHTSPTATRHGHAARAASPRTRRPQLEVELPPASSELAGPGPGVAVGPAAAACRVPLQGAPRPTGHRHDRQRRPDGHAPHSTTARASRHATHRCARSPSPRTPEPSSSAQTSRCSIDTRDPTCGWCMSHGTRRHAARAGPMVTRVARTPRALAPSFASSSAAVQSVASRPACTVYCSFRFRRSSVPCGLMLLLPAKELLA